MLSGQRESITHRKEEGNIFLIMRGPSPHYDFQKYIPEIAKLNRENPVAQVSRCPCCPDNFTLLNNTAVVKEIYDLGRLKIRSALNLVTQLRSTMSPCLNQPP